MINNFDKFLFRASGIGNIVSKSGKLTDTIKTYLNEVFIGEVYGVRKEAYGKALEKGIACEEDGFKMLGDVFYPGKFIIKEKKPVNNDYCKGTADTIPDDFVNDIKNAYSLFSFANCELSWVYEWQLRAYMFLYNKPKARLFYCLNNMPDYMIAEEQRRMFYNQKKWATMENEDYIEACFELEKANKYDHIPLEEKFKFWEIEMDKEKENVLIASVISARKYLNQLLFEHKGNIIINKSILNKQKQ